MNTDEAARRLQQAKTAITNAEHRKAELQGSRRTLLKRLKDEFRLDSLDEGEARIKKLEADRTDQREQLADLLADLDDMTKGLPT